MPSWRAIIQNVMLKGETIRLDGAIRMQPKQALTTAGGRRSFTALAGAD